MVMADLSNSELEKALIEIDGEMRLENINIPARPLVAFSKLSSRYHIEIELRSELGDRINNWFENLYGDRLKPGWSLGATVIVISGDIYKVRIPLMFGTSGFVFDSGPLERKTIVNGREVTLSNIPKHVEGLTPARVQSMTTSECNEVVTIFGKAAVAWSTLASVKFQDFMSEAKADLETSVEHLLSKSPQFGLSRWSSLQAVEKLLKAYIKERGGTVRTIHKLPDLAGEAEGMGLTAIDRTVLASIQCSAGVRYGEESSTMQEAVAAHWAAIQLCSDIAAGFKDRNEWKIVLIDGKSTDGQRKMVLLMRATVSDFARAGVNYVS
jgi:hypothetical protein